MNMPARLCFRQIAPLVTLLGLLAASCRGASADAPLNAVEFAQQEIRTAAATTGSAPLAVDFEMDHAMSPQSYRIEPDAGGRFRVLAGDDAGALYGGFDLAERVRLGTVGELDRSVHAPYVAQRGIKFNVPLDLRTPSYSDCSDAAQANIPEMWSLAFWHRFLDEMSRHRYNVLSLWSLHPFPSMVKVPEFPDVALNDVWRTRAMLDDSFHSWGIDMVRPAMLADHEVVKRITIDEKIAFWREVMRYAKSRGIDVYVFTWNAFTWGATGKYGITDALDNPVTVAYLRASVRELVRTYPLLAGIGITAGENMVLKGANADAVREQWLWSTYGEGIRDALKEDPARKLTLIHRFHMASQDAILAAWKNYPGPFEFSFKYSVAHMYSITHPPFLDPVLPQLQAGRKTWLTVRNDDIYTFRFGDPDYIRDYVTNMPAAEKLAGFYVGPDGFTWGRDFLDRSPGPVGPDLIIRKQWYSFMLLGRLAYDPTLGNAYFERVLAAHFPSADGTKLYAALQAAAQTMPLITRFFWGDIDLKWFPEACLSHPRYHGFYTVKDFVDGESMPGSGVMNIRRWREALANRAPMPGVTPLQIADALDGAAARALENVSALRAETAASASEELSKTLVDCEALGWLARYYADKIRAACALALYDHDATPTEQQAAVHHLKNAVLAWRAYAAARDGQYRPALYNRVGFVDITALTQKVEDDVTLAAGWKPGQERGDSPH